MKRPDKIIYTGVGLIVGSFFVGIIVSDICPSLLTLTTLIFIAGILVASCGIVQIFRKAAKKRNETITPCQTEENSYRNLKVGYCCCCGKRFTYPASTYSENYCASCKKSFAFREEAAEYAAENQHTVCSMCGSDLLLKDVYIIDGASVCRNCFLNEHGNTNSHAGKEAASAIENAVKLLRKRIIDKIIEKPAVKYELSTLFEPDAEKCFPSFLSYGPTVAAVFNLDLKTGKLFVELHIYVGKPYDEFRQDYCSVSAAGFNQIARKYNMSWELQVFNSDDDWAKLFDDDLKAVVASVCATLQK